VGVHDLGGDLLYGVLDGGAGIVGQLGDDHHRGVVENLVFLVGQVEPDAASRANPGGSAKGMGR
jgi:hypothetical protein